MHKRKTELIECVYVYSRFKKKVGLYLEAKPPPLPPLKEKRKEEPFIRPRDQHAMHKIEKK